MNLLNKYRSPLDAYIEPRCAEYLDKVILRYRHADGTERCYDEELVNQLDKYFRQHGVKTVLDVCCGCGNPIVGLAKKGYQVVACDASPLMVEATKNNAIEEGVVLEPVICDWRNVASAGLGVFDIILCVGVSIIHLPTHEDILIALRNFYQVLNPSGLCLIDNKRWDEGLREKRHLLRIFKPTAYAEQRHQMLVSVCEYAEEESGRVRQDYHVYVLDFESHQQEGKNYEPERFTFIGYPIYSSDLKVLMEQAGFTNVKIVNYAEIIEKERWRGAGGYDLLIGHKG